MGKRLSEKLPIHMQAWEAGVSPGADIYFCSVLGKFPNLSAAQCGNMGGGERAGSAWPPVADTHQFPEPTARLQGGRGPVHPEFLQNFAYTGKCVASVRACSLPWLLAGYREIIFGF